MCYNAVQYALRIQCTVHSNGGSMMEKTVQLETFIKNSSMHAPLIGNEFQDILMEGMALLDLTDEACARLFDVSRPTVTRWRNGSTAPHRAMRRLLSDVLKKETTKRLKQHQRRKSHAAVKTIAQSL